MIVPGGNDNCHHIAGTKGFLNLLIGNLAFTLFGGGQIGKAVAIRTLVCLDTGKNHKGNKNRRDDETGHNIKLTNQSNFR